MDDTYLWAESLPFLQQQIRQVEQRLAIEGLHINGDKTECVCLQPKPGETILVGGQTVQVRDPNHPVKVLGAPLTMSSAISVTSATMQQKARAALAGNKATFRGKGSLGHKAIMSDVLIRPSALWGCGTWPCHAALLQAANTVQLRILRDSGGYTRKAGETWKEWNQRFLRMCRVLLHKLKHECWSTVILKQIWTLHGHVARGCEMGKKLLAWKDLLWWQEQQRQRRGKTCRAFQSHGRCRKEHRQNCGDSLENNGAGQRTLGIWQTKTARQPQAEHHTNACQQHTIAAIPSGGSLAHQ